MANAAHKNITPTIVIPMKSRSGPVHGRTLSGRPIPDRTFRNELSCQLSPKSRIGGCFSRSLASSTPKLEAFYRQPVGQKLIEKWPAIARQTAQIGQDVSLKAADDLRLRLTEALRQKGHNL